MRRFSSALRSLPWRRHCHWLRVGASTSPLVVSTTQSRRCSGASCVPAGPPRRSLPSSPQDLRQLPQERSVCPDNGAGSDWLCQLLLQVGTSLTQYTYELTVQATGCYTADGPPGLVGQVTLTTRAGATRVRTLSSHSMACFDSWLALGCLAAGPIGRPPWGLSWMGRTA